MQDKIHTSYKQLEQRSKYTNMFLRWYLYLVLILFALYFIFPLYVMIVTLLKTMEEIRQGTLLTWPSGLNFDSWAVAWGGRGYGAGDTFLKPYFWNSIKMVFIFCVNLIRLLFHLSIICDDCDLIKNNGGNSSRNTFNLAKYVKF